jgi:hypothetical protein
VTVQRDLSRGDAQPTRSLRAVGGRRTQAGQWWEHREVGRRERSGSRPCRGGRSHQRGRHHAPPAGSALDPLEPSSAVVHTLLPRLCGIRNASLDAFISLGEASVGRRFVSVNYCLILLFYFANLKSKITHG